MKLRTRGSFRIMNKVDVVAAIDHVVGTVVITRVRPFQSAKPTYFFVPNDEGKNLGLVTSRSTSLKETLEYAWTEDEHEIEPSDSPLLDDDLRGCPKE